MKTYSYNLVFIDILFNLLIGFVSLFILAFLMMNPIADEGKIDPVTQIMITMTWPDDSNIDMDLWVKGPENAVVGFSRKEAGYMQLDRDDLGTRNDTFLVNGERVTVARNVENVFINADLAGEYFVNVHYFGPAPAGNPTSVIEETTIQVHDMRPFKLVYEGTAPSSYKDEVTVVSFVVDEDGNIIDVNEDVQLFFKTGSSPSTPGEGDFPEQ